MPNSLKTAEDRQLNVFDINPAGFPEDHASFNIIPQHKPHCKAFFEGAPVFAAKQMVFSPRRWVFRRAGPLSAPPRPVRPLPARPLSLARTARKCIGRANTAPLAATPAKAGSERVKLPLARPVGAASFTRVRAVREGLKSPQRILARVLPDAQPYPDAQPPAKDLKHANKGPRHSNTLSSFVRICTRLTRQWSS